MAEIDPRKFDSTQQYLEALGFTIRDDCFVAPSPYVCGPVSFPATEIIGHTPVTFQAKAKAHGWIPSMTVAQIKAAFGL